MPRHFVGTRMPRSFVALFELDRTAFPDDFSSPAPIRRSLPRVRWLLALLVIAALLPRAGMAWRLDVVTEDGPIYIYAAMQLERGNLEAAFRHSNLGLNLYPVVLWGLHNLGLDWEMAGRLWGVLMASLVVLPMFGWIRRQFDDRVAAVACVLYAAHPALIERSPELLRCPTFWMLLMSGIYFQWRAVTEVRSWLFLCAGLCFTLGVHFRIEVWFLLVPWLLWSVLRCVHLRTGRTALVLGAFAGMLVLPVCSVLVNVTWLRHQAQWEWCFSQRASVVKRLLSDAQTQPSSDAAPSTDAITQPPQPAPVVTPAPAPVTAPPVWFIAVGQGSRVTRSLGHVVKAYLNKFLDALNPLFGVFLLVGLLVGHRMLWRADQMAMVAFCLVCLAAVAGFWLLVQDIQGRYFLPIVIVSANYAALGVFALGRGLVALITRWSPRRTPRLAVVHLTILAVAMLVGSADALTNNYDDRHARRELGLWVRDTLGMGQSILGSEPRGWTVAWYAQSRYYGMPLEQLGTPAFGEQVQAMHPAVVFITGRQSHAEASPWYHEFQANPSLSQQFRPVPARCLPVSLQRTLVLVRTSDWPKVVERRAGQAGQLR